MEQAETTILRRYDASSQGAREPASRALVGEVIDDIPGTIHLYRFYLESNCMEARFSHSYNIMEAWRPGSQHFASIQYWISQ